jgi:hypothetical protein
VACVVPSRASRDTRPAPARGRPRSLSQSVRHASSTATSATLSSPARRRTRVVSPGVR